MIRRAQSVRCDLRAVVEHYKQNFRANARAELNSFLAEMTIEDAIARAGCAETPAGRRYSHQRRLKHDDLKAATIRLLERAAALQAAASFAKLYDMVDEAVGHFGGIGELYVYDTSLRIGAKLGRMPEHVFLHAGARKGAAALGMNVKGVRRLFVFDFDQRLRELEAHEIEDVLCIYKAYFAGDADLNDERACWTDDDDDSE